MGCGNGRDAFYFARKGLQVTAVDWSEDCLNQLLKLTAKKDLNIKVIQQNIPQLKIKPNSFDVIYAHLSLHYFDDKMTGKIFNKIYGMLKRNGLFFVKCKSTDDILYGKGRKIEDNMYIFQNHIRHFFDKKYMMSQLKRFQVIRMRKSSSVHHNYKSSFIEAIVRK